MCQSCQDFIHFFFFFFFTENVVDVGDEVLWSMANVVTDPPDPSRLCVSGNHTVKQLP